MVSAARGITSKHSRNILKPLIHELQPLIYECDPVIMAAGIWILLSFSLNFLVKNNKVKTVTNGVDALITLHMQQYDLVVVDVHMPDMNGFQLQHHIQTKFNLPVIFISADDKEEVVRNGMANGAVRFLVKPLKCGDLKDLWQYSVWWQKNKNPAMLLENGLITRDQYDDLVRIDRPSRRRSRLLQNNNNNVAEHIATSYAATAAIDVPDTAEASRTRKLAWTSTMHNRFVEAILIIGYHRAVPKTILEVMNVPGLTREQVASHLQKYRKFLHRVLDRKSDIKYPDWIDFDYYSSHVFGNPNLLLIEQLRGQDTDRDLANPIEQHNNNVPVPGTSSSSILNPQASTATLTPAGFKALPPFTEAASMSVIKNTMNEILVQQPPMSTQGNTLVIGTSTTTDYEFSTNVATRDIGGSTFPYNDMFHVGSSSSAPNIGQSLNDFDIPNNQITYSNQTTAALQNYFSEGFNESNNVFTLINHVGPSSAAFSTSFYSQPQPFNNDGQNSVLFGGNNIMPFSDQQNYVEQVPNIGSPFGENRFGVSSVMNEQVNDIGSSRVLPDNNHLAAVTQNTNPNMNKEENEQGEDNFWAQMMDIDCIGFDKGNNDDHNQADVAAGNGE